MTPASQAVAALKPAEQRVVLAMAEPGTSQVAAAKKIGKTQPTVSQHLSKPIVADTLDLVQAEHSDKARGMLAQLEQAARKATDALAGGISSADPETAGRILLMALKARSEAQTLGLDTDELTPEVVQGIEAFNAALYWQGRYDERANAEPRYDEPDTVDVQVQMRNGSTPPTPTKQGT